MKYMKLKCILPILILGLMFCGMANEGEAIKNRLEDFKYARIGVQTGTTEDFTVHEIFPDAEIVNFSTTTDEAIALDSGKVDAFAVSEALANIYKKEYESFYFVDEPVLSDSIGFAFNKSPEGKELCDEVSAFITSLKADGTLESINQHWFVDGDGESIQADPAQMTGEKGTIKVAIEMTYEPFAYVKHGQPCGFDVDLLYRFGIARGYNIEFLDMNFDAVLVSVATGNCDIAASGITVTKERKESVYFSEPYHDGSVVLVSKNKAIAASNKFDILESFNKTFIRENRWQIILSGIITTIIITIAAAIFGSILGFVLCLVKMKSEMGALIVNIYVKLFQGTPIVIALMVFYYVVFGKFSVPAIVVAIITFMLNFSAYAAEIIRTGIEAVDPGQREAALALGFSEWEAFFTYIFPQAAAHFLPVYKGEVISLLKNTSVVGYITIVDLTRAGDLIRSRTYEAFFPLVVAAIFYYVLSYFLGKIIEIIMRQVTPDRKNRRIKGVRTHD